jgi:hypothetical protein
VGSKWIKEIKEGWNKRGNIHVVGDIPYMRIPQWWRLSLLLIISTSLSLLLIKAQTCWDTINHSHKIASIKRSRCLQYWAQLNTDSKPAHSIQGTKAVIIFLIKSVIISEILGRLPVSPSLSRFGAAAAVHTCAIETRVASSSRSCSTLALQPDVDSPAWRDWGRRTINMVLPSPFDLVDCF